MGNNVDDDASCFAAFESSIGLSNSLLIIVDVVDDDVVDDDVVDDDVVVVVVATPLLFAVSVNA
jgi:hypothetical protein